MAIASLLQPNIEGTGTWAGSLLIGTGLTAGVVAASWLTAAALGIAVGLARTSRRAVIAAPARAWIELFRNVPLLVQFLIWYYALPEAWPGFKQALMRLDVPVGQAAIAVLCLGLFTSARVAEQVRAGLLAVAPGQALAARALGLREGQVLWRVLLPQALRRVLPPLTSESMNLVKNSSVALAIGLPELFLRSKDMGESTGDYVTAFGVAVLLYAALAFAVNRAMVKAERAVALPGTVGAGRS